MQTVGRKRSIRAIIQIGIVVLYFAIVFFIDKVYFEASRWEWPSWSVAAMHTFLWFLASLGGILACHIRARSFMVVIVANGIFVLIHQSLYFVLNFLNIESSHGVYWFGLVFSVNLLIGLFLPRLAFLVEKESPNTNDPDELSMKKRI